MNNDKTLELEEVIKEATFSLLAAIKKTIEMDNIDSHEYVFYKHSLIVSLKYFEAKACQPKPENLGKEM